MTVDRSGKEADGGVKSKPPSTVVRQLEHPERRLSLFFIATSGLLGIVGTALGALMLATLSGIPSDSGPGVFFAHPYLQIYGFIAEFVVGVEYSLLPRFKTGKIPSIRLGYATYLLLTTANAIFIVSAMSPSHATVLGSVAALLILAGSIASAIQVIPLATRPIGGFPETNPLIIDSSVSLILLSLTLLLEFSGLLPVDEFSPQMVLLALVGFAGSMIYSVEIRSVSFRQTDYRKRFVKLGFLAQTCAIAVIFLSIVLPFEFLSLVAAALFLSAALSSTLAIKIFEFSKPLMYRPAMTKMHFAILHYNEVGILSGSLWLLFGLILGIVLTATNSSSFFVRDSFIHSIAIGFIGSTIVVFAPMLLPSLLGRRAPTSGLSYGPIALLNAGLVIRIAGNSMTLISSSSLLPFWESISGPLILGAIVWFFVVIHNVGRKRISVQSSQHMDQGLDDVRDATIKIASSKEGKDKVVAVWFTKVGATVYLLPIHGSRTRWLQTLSSDPEAHLEIAGHNLQGEARIATEKKEVNQIIRLFKDKYGERVYRNFYGENIDRAVIVAIKKSS